MALLQPAGLIGIHTNMPATVPPDIDKAAFAGAPAPSGLSTDERQAYDQLAYFYKHGLGYAQEMANRPQTLYGIGDSPVGVRGLRAMTSSTTSHCTGSRTRRSLQLACIGKASSRSLRRKTSRSRPQ